MILIEKRIPSSCYQHTCYYHVNRRFNTLFIILVACLLVQFMFTSYVFASSSSPSASSASSASIASVITASTWTDDNTTCPSQCKCLNIQSKWVNETFHTVDCSFVGLKRFSFRELVPRHTQSLWLSGNRINDLYSLSSINHHENLIELDLSANLITTLGRSSLHPFLTLAHLKYLNLSSNGFKTLFPGVFRGLKRLERLSLTSGQLRYIDEHAFDGLENLSQLNLQENRINSIFLELFQSIVNLHVLNLDGNSITHLTGGIFTSLNKLQQLSLSHNYITVMDDNSLVGLDSLIHLDLSFNRLTKVPTIALQSLKRIGTINLSGNPFVTLGARELIHLPVNSIVLSHCPLLTSIERLTFWDLPDLLEATITHNPRLVFIDVQAFTGTPRLNRLYLDGNGLLTLEPELVNNIVNQRQLIATTHHYHVHHVANGHSPTTAIHQQSTSPHHHYHHHHHHYNHQPPPQQLQPSPHHFHHNHHYQKSTQSPPSTLEPEPYLTISLTSNPLLCDCNVHYIYQCLKPGNRSRVLLINSDKLTCYHPSNKTSLVIKDIDIATIPNECVPRIITDSLLSSNETIVLNGSIGDKISLNCRAIGKPTPSIRWILPSGDILEEPMNNNNNTSSVIPSSSSSSSSTLTSTSTSSHVQLIRSTNQLRLNHLKPSDSGKYKCIAENRQGSAETTFNLIVEQLRVQIWPLGISSTFVSVVWNSTSLSSFTSPLPQSSLSSSSSSSATATSLPEYQILYKSEDDPSDRFETISVGHYLRSYTINHLEPRKRYKLCIAVRDSESHGSYIQLSCTLVTTSSDSSISYSSSSSSISASSGLSSSSSSSEHSFLHESLTRDTSSYIAIALTLTLTALAIVVLAFTIVGARRAFLIVNRVQQQRQFETPQKSLVHNMDPIPLAHIPFDQDI